MLHIGTSVTLVPEKDSRLNLEPIIFHAKISNFLHFTPSFSTLHLFSVSPICFSE
jgi:hypothetical protein